MAMGLVTFLLAGALGLLLTHRSPLPPSRAFHNLMPAFIGLFTVPWLLLNAVTRVTVPAQTIGQPTGPPRRLVVAGSLAGLIGGGFAAFFPLITGGVGSLLAGHATGLRDDRAFLISQGASRTVYYVGAFLLFFLPGLHLTRGGAALTIAPLCRPYARHDFYAILAASAAAGAVALLLLPALARGMIWLLSRWGRRRLTVLSLAAAPLLVVVMTGWSGLLVAVTATGIGLLPLLHGARRMNGLGLLLLPAMAG